MFSPRDAFVVPLERVSALAIVFQGRIPHLLLSFPVSAFVVSPRDASPYFPPINLPAKG